MNRRLLLIVACAILPSASLDAQIVQPGEVSADKRAHGGRADADERKARKKGTLSDAGLAIGGGTAFAFRTDAEHVAQQDFCIGACQPLRTSSRLSHTAASVEHFAPLSSSSEVTTAKHGGVLALLEAVGNVSDHAIDALTRAPVHSAVAGDVMSGSTNAATHRTRAASHGAGGAATIAAHQPDFTAAMHGCVLGCPPPASARLVSSPGAEEGLFAAAGSVGPVVLAGGDVNMIVNPEPSTVALMLSGLAAMAFIARRKRSVG